MNTREQVIDIIVNKLGVERESVVDSASFINDLGADSLDTVELIMEFEREFEINIPDNQAESISTVGEAISFVENAVNNK
jgi:acyl carrier protein